MPVLEPNLFVSFPWAVVRLATYVADSSVPPRLLFGSVTLLTNDRSRPTGGKGLDKRRLGNRKRETVFFRRTVLTAEDAIQWYRSASPIGITTPVPSDQHEIENNLDGKPLAPSEFEDDPDWPTLGLPARSDLLFSVGGPEDPAPFLGSGSKSARIHRRFGDGSEFDTVTADAAAIAFLKRRLHFDLAD